MNLSELRHDQLAAFDLGRYGVIVVLEDERELLEALSDMSRQDEWERLRLQSQADKWASAVLVRDDEGAEGMDCGVYAVSVDENELYMARNPLSQAALLAAVAAKISKDPLVRLLCFVEVFVNAHLQDEWQECRLNLLDFADPARHDLKGRFNS